MTTATQDRPEQTTISHDEAFEIRRQHRANIPDLHHGAYRRLWDKAMTGRSLRAAVRSKCLDCMNWQSVEVKMCTCVACPLFPYRPGQKRNRTPATVETPQGRAILRARVHATHTLAKKRPQDGL